MLFIFDMGGVVTRDEGFTRRLLNMIQMTSEEFNAAIKGGCYEGVCKRDIMLSLSNGAITEREFFDEVERRTGRKINSKALALAFNPVRDKEVASIIHRLRERGERVVCGTNTIECHYMEHIERGDYALFDKVYASNRIGISKPDRAFFKAILTAEETEAKDAFFTDDREDNCFTAKELGINVHRYTNAGALECALKEWL